MELFSTDVELVGDELRVGGKSIFGDLMERAKQEGALIRQRSLTAGLPEEDFSPGHVVPAVIPTDLAAA